MKIVIIGALLMCLIGCGRQEQLFSEDIDEGTIINATAEQQHNDEYLLWDADHIFRRKPNLFVSYQGWKNDNEYVYNWSEITTPPIKDGAQLKELANEIAKINGYKQVIILNFYRFERGEQ